MRSKYELTISPNYVPDWTYVEAIRELFQNALDNEITNSENKMLFDYDGDSQVLRICNKTSILQLDSLLLGFTTKADDKNTIGQHGEGYKVAFVVLLREGKSVKVYNYGKREIWTTALVKSRRYNNQLVPVVYVEKEAVWKQVPDHDLTVEVSGITSEEYDKIVQKNLNLQKEVNAFDIQDKGRILLDEVERGNLYVKGLYICHNNSIQYGYDFDPRIITLDRDRKFIESFAMTWETSYMWKYAYAHGFKQADIIKLIKDNAYDVSCIKDRYLYDGSHVEEQLSDDMAKDFVYVNGPDSVPVKNNDELRSAQNIGLKPIMVSETEACYISKSENVKVAKVPDEMTLKEEFQTLLDTIEHKLSDEEVEWFSALINRL